MRKDPLPAVCYKLSADNTTIAFLKSASFPTMHLFKFEAPPLLLDRRFLDSAASKRGLPFHRWSLVTFNTALQPIGRVEWNQAEVKLLRFPALNNPSTGPLSCLFEMVVSGVTEVDPQSDSNGTIHTASAASTRKDPLPMFAFETKIDGLDDLTWNVSRIESFDIGPRASQELVLTIKPEANADPLRNWLSSGNTPRGGSLVFLDAAMNTIFTVRFTGLRVQSVTPAITTHSPNPATVRLMYSDISFGNR